MKATDMNLMIEQCGSTARFLKLLAHPQRLLLLCHLTEGERTVSELEEVCEASQSHISQFLQRMKNEGLVSARREGKFIYYSIGDRRVLKLIRSLHNIFCIKPQNQ